MKLKEILKVNRRKIIAAIVVMIAVAAIGGGIYLKSYFDYVNAVESIDIGEIDMSLIQDGKYTGQSDVGFISAKVELEVVNHKIVKIDLLEHKNERGKQAEVIVDEIIKNQSLDVDAVSSATNSSKVIKEAVQNALITKE